MTDTDKPDVGALVDDAILAASWLSDKDYTTVRDALLALQAEVARITTERDDYKQRCALDDSERETRRQSLAQEIRDTLKTRGFFAPSRPSDLIGAVARALESVMTERDRLEGELEQCRISLDVWKYPSD